MALTPLNEFKNIPYIVTTSNSIVYTAPIAVTTIVLHAQVANITNNTVGIVTFTHIRQNNITHVVKGAEVAINDALVLIAGKFVLEEGDSLKIIGNSNNTMEMLMSILETSG